MNANIAKAEVAIIKITRYKPKPPLSNDLGSLMPANATKISKVNVTAIWLTSLFKWGFFEIMALHRSKRSPKMTGINAVGDDTSTYPHNPMMMRHTAFNRLAFIGVIFFSCLLACVDFYYKRENYFISKIQF